MGLRYSTRRDRHRSRLTPAAGWKQEFAQSGTAPHPASCLSPTDPALRANPFPEVTDLVCRLPLPTLFYRPEAVHLGDLLRIWVRSRTKITPSPSDFQGPTRAHRTPQETWCFTGHMSLSPGEPIPGSPPLTKKRELFPGPTPAFPSSFAFARTRRRSADLRVEVREY
ncbi:unnamed protein product [Clavelina lepadiformis]|uniref:Uncharacterized protein n=1 Tax=Clavelina lepadiformis TaxID=159417 RepID=A0ABP0FCQ5_CLALP